MVFLRLHVQWQFTSLSLNIIIYSYSEILCYGTGTGIPTVEPIPVAARSKDWVCGRSRSGIVGSNSAGYLVVFPL
jgi:hypothetical protein